MRHKSLLLLLSGLTIGALCGVGCQKTESVAPIADLASKQDFNTQAGHFFPSVAEAANWTRNYRNKYPRLSSDGHTNKVLYSTYFGSSFLRQIMDQPDCVGIRFYKAIDPKGDEHILAVGTDANGNDLVLRRKVNTTNNTSSIKGTEDTEVMVGNWGHRCPDYCSTGELSGN
ncbi:hypothetical protein [Hymenobacter sp. DG01]|uniref:hypothetical protein n=1 Tax=Hymenobacter sp. DG01 TaxID=2584940 RepID=UPI0011242367|nr:hypothetical protein [Hymenobacter sp. DG01]